MLFLRIILASIGVMALFMFFFGDLSDDGVGNAEAECGVTRDLAIAFNLAIIIDLLINRRLFTRCVYSIAAVFLAVTLAPHVLRTIPEMPVAIGACILMVVPYAWVAVKPR